MGVYVSTLELPGNKFISENKLPKFRDKVQDKKLDGDGLLDSEKHLYGYQTGDRVLPYLVQDMYSRKRSTVSLKTIVMENDYLTATFLPEYGMRLYSLYSKTEKRELLYVNPVMQISNLAIRFAWFSGGIEWNVSQLGHTFTTCESIYASICKDEDGHEFIRAYEYERCKGIYWSIDFHLGTDDRHLATYVRIINPKDEAVSTYWWTNTAVPEEREVRIFSGTEEVIYINPTSNEAQGIPKGMAHGTIPHLSALPHKDASYPEKFDYASEYFFQNEKDVHKTWEAAVYNDNTMFYERSSDILRYRKMFCWGSHNGGKRWQEFLSTEGGQRYVEIQAGLAPTQVHGLELPENTVWDFVQVFGGTSIEYSPLTGNWNDGKEKVFEKINSEISSDAIEKLLLKYKKNAEIAPIKILHLGNGFGAIEDKKNPHITPKGLTFPVSSITEKELVWVSLLDHGTVNDIAITCLPSSYMVDMRYEKLLQVAAEKNSYTAYNLLGSMYFENGCDVQAEDCFNKSLKIVKNPLAYRNLYTMHKDSTAHNAIMYFDKAIELLGEDVCREYVEEYICALNKVQMYSKAWDYYTTLPRDIQNSGRVILHVLKTAVELENLDFLTEQYSKEFAVIREGERDFTEAYFAYQAMRDAKEGGVKFTKEHIDTYVAKNDIPYKFDFRLTQV